MKKTRIELTDNIFDVVTKMSEGNPEAVSTLMEIITSGKEIDSDNMMGGLGAVLFLDTLEIYGTDIYILYNDICDRNIAKTIAVLKAVQMGIFDGKILQNACSKQDYSGKKMVPVEDLYKKIRELLPNFNSKYDPIPEKQ